MRRNDQTLDHTPADAARAFMRELERDIEARTGNAHAAAVEAARRGGETLDLV